MSGWNEQTLRSAASWQSFKEGKTLFDQGAVTAVKKGSSGWQGMVSTGKRPLRVSVTVKSPTDLETRCPCPENQSSGAFCCHAVATGLATLSNAAPVPSPTPAATAARDLLLPPQWRDALARGKLTATVSASSRVSLDSADLRLSAWLASERAADAPNLHLHLDATRAAAFLDAIAGHPGVFTGKERTPLVITSGHRIHLAGADLRGDEVTLTPEDARWLELEGTFWQAGENFLKRASTATPPAELRGILQSLARGETATAPVRQILFNLDAWQDWLAFPADCWLESIHFIPAAASFGLALEGSLQQLQAHLTVSYPGALPVIPGFGHVSTLPKLIGKTCEIRDFSAERRAVECLKSAGFQTSEHASGLWLLSGESAILRFIAQTLPSLSADWQITEDTRFTKARQQVSVVSPKIEILGSGEDWLSFDLKFQTSDGIEVPREEIQRLLRSVKNTGRLAGGRQAVLGDDFIQVIEPLFSELDFHQRSGHFEASGRTGELIMELRKKFDNTLISNISKNLLTYSQPATLRAELRHYQEQGTAWLLDRVKRFGGALLADDMGLGKTLQTIALIEILLARTENDSNIALVVATTSLLGNWRAEFGRFAPGRRVRILHGGHREQEREKLEPGDVILTSYGTLARDLAWHLRQDYRAVVVDEASLMRNPDTDHAKALSKLRARHRIALTGTPVENGVRDLWSIFRFIQPGWLGGREDFRERYELALSNGEGASAVMERLKLRISPFILRRTKEQVAPELPSKLIIDEFCDLSADQQAVYRDLLAEGRRQVEDLADSKNDGAARMRMLTTLLRLRQSCCDLALLGNERLQQLAIPRRSAKMERLLELLSETVNGNHRVLVFSQFQKQLLEIEKCIHERDWRCLRLDGQTRNRQEMVDKFQDLQGPPVFLISLKAGGYGLNLTAADTVIHFDPWWNPAAEAQATDRAHRIGQTRPVTVYRLLTRGTVEEQVVRLQQRKRQLAAAIDESGGGDAPGWSVKDLQALINAG